MVHRNRRQLWWGGGNHCSRMGEKPGDGYGEFAHDRQEDDKFPSQGPLFSFCKLGDIVISRNQRVVMSQEA